MKSQREVEAELFRLLETFPAGAREVAVIHLEGRVRSFCWVLTGRDVGIYCLGGDIAAVFKFLGWRYEYENNGNGVKWWLPEEPGGTRGYSKEESE